MFLDKYVGIHSLVKISHLLDYGRIFLEVCGQFDFQKFVIVRSLKPEKFLHKYVANFVYGQ